MPRREVLSLAARASDWLVSGPALGTGGSAVIPQRASRRRAAVHPTPVAAVSDPTRKQRVYGIRSPRQERNGKSPALNSARPSPQGASFIGSGRARARTRGTRSWDVQTNCTSLWRLIPRMSGARRHRVGSGSGLLDREFCSDSERCAVEVSAATRAVAGAAPAQSTQAGSAVGSCMAARQFAPRGRRGPSCSCGHNNIAQGARGLGQNELPGLAAQLVLSREPWVSAGSRLGPGMSTACSRDNDWCQLIRALCCLHSEPFGFPWDLGHNAVRGSFLVGQDARLTVPPYRRGQIQLKFPCHRRPRGLA